MAVAPPTIRGNRPFLPEGYVKPKKAPPGMMFNPDYLPLMEGAPYDNRNSNQKDEFIPVTKVDIRQHGQPKVEEGFPILPFDDVCYVEVIKEETTRGGIVIPVTASYQKMPMGRVVAVGPGRFYAAAMNASQTLEAAVFVPSRLNIGDIVVWGRYRTGGERLEIGSKEYVACREGDLGGVLRDGKIVNIRVIKETD